MGVRAGRGRPEAMAADALEAARSAVPEDPVVLGALVAAGVVLVLALAGIVYWRRRPAGKRLSSVLGNHDAVTVLMHPNPDPDAMSCAVAAKTIAERAGTDVALQYPGEIRHQENRAFQTVLDLHLDRVDTAADLAHEDVMLVDHNEPRGFEGASDVDPIAVVDHHPGGGTGSEYTDVRADYGACASIFAEYLDGLGIKPGADDDRSDLESDVATGLVYGIQSDTNHLTKGCSSAEFEAAAYLYPGIDEDALDRVANPQVSAEVLETKARAIRDREVRASFSVCDVGEVSNVDAIPQAADELLNLEGVTAVVVFGSHDGTLHVSGRSRDDRVHMGEALRAVCEDIPMASAGGHARMGGGQLSIEHMAGIGPSNGVTRDEFRNRLFDAMSGELA